MLKTSPQAEREVRRNSPIRRARTCYDHLAGVAGVQLFAELIKRGWITEAEGENHPAVGLTLDGESALASRGVNVARVKESKRKFGYGCLDWTEREHHLGGALGAEVLKTLQKSSRVIRNNANRVAEVASPISHWLDAETQ